MIYVYLLSIYRYTVQISVISKLHSEFNSTLGLYVFFTVLPNRFRIPGTVGGAYDISNLHIEVAEYKKKKIERNENSVVVGLLACR